MELFYGIFTGASVTLDAEESGHCIRVLRHRAGDEINVIDGTGLMARCRLVDDNPKGAVAQVLERFDGWGAHPYRLTLACCPTKNNDRFEWFVEKATELGVDRIVPLIGERSERRIFKADRARKIALSATKQSLKATIPAVTEPVSVKAFLQAEENAGPKMIACCFEGETPRTSILDVLKGCPEACPDITVLIGPEGDFSPEEVALAVARGYTPIHMGPSRLRTETAAVTAVEAVYLAFI